MGVCSGKQKQRNNIEQEQIARAVQEDQEIIQQEEFPDDIEDYADNYQNSSVQARSPKFNDFNDLEDEVVEQQEDQGEHDHEELQYEHEHEHEHEHENHDEQIIQVEQQDEEVEGDKEKKKKKHKKDKNQDGEKGEKKKADHHQRRHKEEINYFKRLPYNINVNKLTQEFIRDPMLPHYKLIINVGYMNYDYDIELKGIFVGDPDYNTISIAPFSYQEASQYSRVLAFFTQDNYFNANVDDHNNANYFDRLLLVERKVQIQTSLHHSPTKKLTSRRQTMDDASSPSKKQSVKTKQQTIREMMEVAIIFDFEIQQRFLSILFHILLQTKNPELNNCLVFIQETYILYESLPQLDVPNLYRVLLFYPALDYSLKDLLAYLQYESMELTHICYMKLCQGLLKILVQCYQKYLYRLNVTLTSIFYCRDQKTFKLQSFGRIKSLLPFENDIDVQLDRKEVKDFKHFYRSFQKDLQSVSDIMLLFKKVKGNTLKSIKGLRKKVIEEDDMGREIKQIDSTEYIAYIDSIFSEEDAKIADAAKYSVNKVEQIDIKCKSMPLLEELVGIIEQIDQQIYAEEKEFIERLKNKDKFESDSEGGGEEQDEEEEEQRSCDTFDFDFNLPTRKIALNPDTLNDQEIKYKQMLYSSLTMNSSFLDCCQDFLNENLEMHLKVHAIILNSYAQVQNEKDEAMRKQKQIELLDSAVQLFQQSPSDQTDNLHFHLLLKLILLIPNRPYSLLIQLQRSIQKQYEYKVHMGSKLQGVNEAKGKVELRKNIILQLFFAENSAHGHFFSQAANQMQKIVTFQLKNDLNNSILYGYTLFVNGLICERTLQSTSSMLNLEMAKQIYDQYFPQYKQVWTEVVVNVVQHEQKKQEIENQLVTEEIINLSTDNIATLEFHLGIVYFNLRDQENALKSLKRSKKLRSGRFEEFSDEIIEITIQMLRIYVEQEETGQAIEICQQYAKRIDQCYKMKKVIKGKQLAKLLFIMAAIYQSSGVLLSALRYFTRANKLFTLMKTNSYLKQMHIQTKIKEILIQVKEKAYIVNNMANDFTGAELKSYGGISDNIKPYFNNQFYRQSAHSQIIIVNPRVSDLYIITHGLFKNGESQAGIKKIKKIMEIYKATKKDECYGLVLEKYGIIALQSNQVSEGRKYLQFAIEVHDRFLSFPMKEQCLLRCSILIMISYALEKSLKKVIEEFEKVEQYITDYHKIIQWNPVAERVRQNKFLVLSAKAGVKILYQLIDLELMIDSYYKTKKKLVNHLDNMDKLKDAAEHCIKYFIGKQKGTNNWISMRQSCLFGQSAKVSITKRRNAFNQQLEGIKVLDTVAIPQDDEHRRPKKKGQNDEKPTVSKAIKGVLQQKVEQDMFTRETEVPKKVTIDIRRPTEQFEERKTKRKTSKPPIVSPQINLPEEQVQIIEQVGEKQKEQSQRGSVVQSQNISISSKKGMERSTKSKINPFQKIQGSTIKK